MPPDRSTRPPGARAARAAPLVALLLGLALLAHALAQSPARLGPDGAIYRDLAAQAAAAPSLLDCGNLAHAYWAPGWVIALAALERAVGADLRWVRGLLVVCALLAAWLVYRLTARWAGPRAGLAALVLCLAARFTFLYTTYCQYEIPQALTLVAAGALLFPGRAGRAGSGGPDARGRAGAIRAGARDLLAGACLAASALFSGRALALLPLVPLALAREAGWRRALLRTLVVVCGAALVLGPWAVRNHRCEGRWILATTNGGYNLWLGNNPRSTGGYYNPRPADLPPWPLHETDAWTREAVRYAAAHPVQTAARSLVKAARFWVPLYADQVVLLALAAAGLWRLARDRRLRAGGLAAWAVGVPLALCVVQAGFFVQARFFVAAQPWVAMLAGVGLTGAFPAARDRGTMDADVGAAGAEARSAPDVGEGAP